MKTMLKIGTSVTFVLSLLGVSTCVLAHAPPGQDEGGNFVPERAGYYDTVWPSEHTDLWRSHAALNAGLPADFDPELLTVSTVRLNLPMWGYTRKRNEVFVIGGQPVSLDSFTQMIKDGMAFSGERIFLSILRDLTDPSVPYVAKVKVKPKAMVKTRQLFLTRGWTVNYTGGLLMHENGYLYAVARSFLYKINPSSMRIVQSYALPLVGDNRLDQFWTTYNGLQVLASGKLVLKGFYFLPGTDILGWLLLIDPGDLSKDPVEQETLVSSARLTIEQTADGKAWLYHVNETESLRFEITDTAFVLDNAWTRTYRSDDDDSTHASSQLLFGNIGQTVFADNSPPAPATGIQLYIQPVDTLELPPPPDLIGSPAFMENFPGFNFFMVAGDPFQSQIVVYYDPINNLVAAHNVLPNGMLTTRWDLGDLDRFYKASASPAIAPDRDLLYIDDYRDGQDNLVVLKLSTGEELARVPLEASLPTIGTIFLGMNDDVYIISSEAGGSDGLLSRVCIARDNKGKGKAKCKGKGDDDDDKDDDDKDDDD